MTYLSQKDPRWANIPLGTALGTTIGTHGCTITSLAMIFGTTPDVVNTKLLAVNGYSNGNLVIWTKIMEAFPGSTVRRVFGQYDNEDVKNNVPCLVEVDFDGTPRTDDRHWVVYLGDQTLADPWTGTVRPTNVYPALSYAIVKPAVAKQEDDSYLAQLKSQIEATSQCQIQLKTTLDLLTAAQAKADTYISTIESNKVETDELRRKYEDEQRTVISLKDEIAKIHQEDKNYGQEALDAQHLAKEREKILFMVAERLDLQYDPTNDKKLVEDILEKIALLQKEQQAAQVPEIRQLELIVKRLMSMGINSHLTSKNMAPIDPTIVDPHLPEKVDLYLNDVVNELLSLNAQTLQRTSAGTNTPTTVIKRQGTLSNLVKSFMQIFFDTK